MMGLTRCYKMAVFLHLYLQFFYLNPLLRYYYFCFLKSTAILKFYFRFLF